MTSTELEAGRAMLLDAVAMLPADIRPMVRVGVEQDILTFRGEGRALSFVARNATLELGGILDDGRPAGHKGPLRDVSADALAARLEGMIRRWLAGP